MADSLEPKDFKFTAPSLEFSSTNPPGTVEAPLVTYIKIHECNKFSVIIFKEFEQSKIHIKYLFISEFSILIIICFTFLNYYNYLSKPILQLSVCPLFLREISSFIFQFKEVKR